MSTGAFDPRLASLSTWQRLRFTPLRDLVFGRLTGRLCYESMLDAAGLPHNIRLLVDDVLRRTRLTRLEKSDVLEELIGHFQDGIDAGATSDELVRRFGDPRVAAQLIRRSKLRCRPIVSKAVTGLTRAMGVLLACLVVVYGVLAVRLYSSEARISRDYLADMNASAVAVPETDRAWPVYRQAILAKSGATPKLYRLPDGSLHDLEAIKAYVAANAESVQLTRQAAARAGLGYVLGFEPDIELLRKTDPGYVAPERPPGSAGGRSTALDSSLIGVLLPGLAPMRELARLVALDAIVSASDGAADRTAEDLATLVRMAEHLSETPTLISELVSVAVLSLACETTGDVIERWPALLSEEQIVAQSHRLGGYRGGGAIRVNVGVERAFFDDIIQRLYTDDGQGNGHLAANGFNGLMVVGDGSQTMPPSWANAVLMPAVSFVAADRATVIAEYDRLMAMTQREAATPLWERGRSEVDLEVERLKSSPIESIRLLPISILFPFLSRVSVLSQFATTQRDATLVVLALEMQRRRTGALPATLDELTPALLPRVPADCFDGRGLRYRLSEGRAVIYSVGADRDDDDGRPPSGERGNERAKAWNPDGSPEVGDIDGDWVLWPAQRQSPPPADSP